MASLICSPECSSEFTRCIAYHEELLQPAYIACRAELDNGRNPLGQVCESGCRDTAHMLGYRLRPLWAPPSLPPLPTSLPLVPPSSLPPKSPNMPPPSPQLPKPLSHSRPVLYGLRHQ